MMRFFIAFLTAVIFTSAVRADTVEPPLYVAIDGIDASDCTNTTSPCRSISYALQQVGKHGEIRVGAGNYTLDSVEDVIYLLSGAIDVRGGHPAGVQTTLIGVPHEFANALAKKGFAVIVDAKGVSQQQSRASQKLVQTHQSVTSNTAATTCTGGFAGVFPCDNVDLLAHLSAPSSGIRGADIWGYMDLNTNREYAIVGFSSGTAVYDVSDAENPRQVGFIDGQSTTWRDIKVHQFWNTANARWNAYAYVTADNSTDGLFIINLNQLPHSISRVSYNSDFARAHNVYLTDTDFSTGLSISGDSPTLILAGSNLSDGRFRSYSLANPASPAFIASVATPPNQAGTDRLYMHDAASMVVTGSRKDTQCVNAVNSDHCDVLFDFNESSFEIWDVTDISSPTRLSQTSYASSGYVHSGWWTEDQQFLFVQDELDERDRGLAATTLRVFSIADLSAPIATGTWTGPTNAIDHNGFVHGNRYYMSNYTRGLTILDITDASNPQSVGRFDTYPSSDTLGFPGNWGAYPYFPSGNIGLSDIDSGFYLVADNTLDVAAGALSFTASAFGSDELQTLDFVVQRAGGSQGVASVSWEVVAATGSNDDVATTSGTLSWPDGDSSNRTVSLGLNNDGSAEGLERLLIKLSAPTGGATLSSPSMTSAYISDPGATAAVSFANAAFNISERGFGTAVAVLQRSGSAIGAISVDFIVSDGDATASSDYSGPANGTVSWADGDADPKCIEYSIVDDGSGEPDEFLQLTLTNVSGGSLGSNSQLRINILDGSGASSAPNAIAGVSQTVAGGVAVTLDGSGSNDPDGDALTYLWTQTLGPAVTLTNADTVTASFAAPTVTSDTLLRFDLQVVDSNGQSDISTISVTVTAPASANRGGGGALSIYLLLGLLGFIGSVIRKDAP